MTGAHAAAMDIFCTVIDWGTSRFRLWAMGPEGDVLASRSGDDGMSTLAPDQYEGVLEGVAGALGIGPDVPAMVCGMAGATGGWCLAPYVDVPTKLDGLADRAVRVPAIERDVRILPGLAQRGPLPPDVMRGEETILLGLAASGITDGVACLPGTHSKWVMLEAGAVGGFQTAMTGEVFGLLAERSTLSHFAAADAGAVEDMAAFGSGVAEALDRPAAILNALFSVRAGPLLDPDLAAAARSRLSGLLIGLEVAGQRDRIDGPVRLVADGLRLRLYAEAFEIAGIEHVPVDAETATRAGLWQAARSVWGSCS